MQTRLQSFIESIANILVGYFIAVGSQMLIFPMFGIITSIKTNIYIGLWFTVISLIRSYILRRFFNELHSAQRRRKYASVDNY